MISSARPSFLILQKNFSCDHDHAVVIYHVSAIYCPFSSALEVIYCLFCVLSVIYYPFDASVAICHFVSASVVICYLFDFYAVICCLYVLLVIDCLFDASVATCYPSCALVAKHLDHYDDDFSVARCLLCRLFELWEVTDLVPHFFDFEVEIDLMDRSGGESVVATSPAPALWTFLMVMSALF